MVRQWYIKENAVILTLKQSYPFHIAYPFSGADHLAPMAECYEIFGKPESVELTIDQMHLPLWDLTKGPVKEKIFANARWSYMVKFGYVHFFFLNEEDALMCKMMI